MAGSIVGIPAATDLRLDGFDYARATNVDLNAYLALITEQPGTGRRNALSTLISGLVDAGIWPLVDGLKLFSSWSPQAATIDLKSRASITPSSISTVQLFDDMRGTQQNGGSYSIPTTFTLFNRAAGGGGHFIEYGNPWQAQGNAWSCGTASGPTAFVDAGTPANSYIQLMGSSGAFPVANRALGLHAISVPHVGNNGAVYFNGQSTSARAASNNPGAATNTNISLYLYGGNSFGVGLMGWGGFLTPAQMQTYYDLLRAYHLNTGRSFA